MQRLLVGTSGWNYRHWADGIFYPSGLGQNRWLEYYSKFFNAVELNVTFYRLVSKKTFRNWYERTPKNFYFIVKGSRFITHIKRLHEVKQPLNLFIKNLSGLNGKLAGILWQLPPSLKKNLKRLELFIKLLKKTAVRQVFEFRNESWFDKEVFDLFKKYNICLCIAHSGGRFPCVKEITSDFLYLRFHGCGSLYTSNYSDKELKNWANFTKDYKHKEIFTFFNNDACGYAVKNALRFRELID